MDDGLVLVFPAPHSFTGETVVEFHSHGSMVALQLLLAEVLREAGVRLAEPGEFTRRALVNGKVDLLRAEAIADLIGAENAAQVHAAAAQLAGELTERLTLARRLVLEARAQAEGLLEFPEEAGEEDEEFARLLGEASGALATLLADAERGVLLRRGARVVLYGPPNAGKSTLFNALVGADRAIVDEAPGTTRDSLEAPITLGDLPLVLVDTAGLREGGEAVEAKGMRRTREALAGAAVGVLVIPPEASPAAVAAWRSEFAVERRLEVASKSDLLPEAPANGVSGETGQGVERLRVLLRERLGGAAEAALVTNERHLSALRRAADSCARAQGRELPLELVAAELGFAAEALGELTGENVTQALIDAIFSRFCIGK